ncbi:hypothetical protein H2248_011489 [Termitomyces sp. 'cryptogamus']|nr:hypothetical protein H2248_011489 [Termitomyces sp. 'cryptogamus']
MHVLREPYHHIVHVLVEGLETFWDKLKLLKYSLDQLAAEEAMNNLALGLECTHLVQWKAYLKWEESDPLELAKNEKCATLMSSIQHVYDKAFIYMWHHHEIWLMASEWLDKVGEYDRALMILNMGSKATNSKKLMDAKVLQGRSSVEALFQLDRLSLGDKTLTPK